MLHGKLQNVAEQRALLYGLSAIGITVLLSLHTFVTSTLSHVPSAMLGFLLNTGSRSDCGIRSEKINPHGTP